MDSKLIFNIYFASNHFFGVVDKVGAMLMHHNAS